MPEYEVPSTMLKAYARKLITENAPKPLLVSLLFVAVITAIAELQIYLSGTALTYQQYVEQIIAETTQSISFFLSYESPPSPAFIIRQIITGTAQSVSLFFSHLNPFSPFLIIALWLLGGVFRAGLMSYSLNLYRGRRSSAFDILDGFLILGKIILILCISSVVILLWSLLFLIPGIVAFYRYRQALFILLDDPKKSAMQCIRESKLIMHGNKFNLFLVDFSFFGWIFLSMGTAFLLRFVIPFPLPLISVFVWPYISLSNANFYDGLIKKIRA